MSKHKEWWSAATGVAFTIAVMAAGAVAGGALMSRLTGSQSAASIAALGCGIAVAWLMTKGVEWWNDGPRWQIEIRRVRR